jgi:hypothetical protein
MNKKQTKTVTPLDIEEIAERAMRGLDVSEHFTGQHTAKQYVSIDFPLELLRAIDAECQKVGVTRQAWIKMACDERLRQVQSGRSSLTNAASGKA